MKVTKSPTPYTPKLITLENADEEAAMVRIVKAFINTMSSVDDRQAYAMANTIFDKLIMEQNK